MIPKSKKTPSIMVAGVIRRRRKELKKSSKDMAAMLSVGIRTYQRMESGVRLRAVDVERICEILDLDIAYIPKENIYLINRKLI